ncbi:DUF4124 domain-containing protein [Parachitinimonas caeni]|uniref:DUF4124 domain-containing protein n=1 Tax=Parachitinimonas caeni TaxID=3031301 RepID=A0ABT7DXN5_9NEIS|nr:DUF4124 domain-containing protein [Parachitinimonas caeni]MDK2124836.1 DUF4124 domain-containing protein [Parachitinimonas caeni]
MSFSRSFLILAGAMLLGQAEAEVFKCRDGSGKITYSEAPCPTGQSGTSLKLPTNTVTPIRSSAESLAPSASRPPEGKTTGPEKAAKPAEPAKPQTGSQPKPWVDPRTDQQIIAECEANRGNNCTDPSRIANEREMSRPLNPDERPGGHLVKPNKPH